VFYRFLRLATAAVCGYECVAILWHREKVPTFSNLAGRHRWLAPALLVALAWHLWWDDLRKIREGNGSNQGK
jgi:hypothetical protein